MKKNCNEFVFYESKNPPMSALQRFIAKKELLIERLLLSIYCDEIFYSIFQMMIDEALAESIQSISSITQKPIFQKTFHLLLEEKTYQNVVASLYDDFIILTIKKQSQTIYLKVGFTFDLIFDLLRSGSSEGQLKVLEEPEGLRFQRFEKELTLKSLQNHHELVQWRNVMEKKVNQRGFHELFKPIKKVGKGNFASVYLVIKHEDSKKYAVKAFSKEGTYSEEKGKQSLVNEIDVMRKLNHKNLMKLYGVYESQNSIYVSVELLEGGQLYDKIKNKHKFSSTEVKLVMKGILEGLEVMHQHKIMHRDLKPENILLRKEGDFDCVIADFGLAEHCQTEQYMFVRCGTPGYVAPEIVNLKDLKAKYDPICDLFSLGVIFHLLVMRKSPFPGKEYDEVLSQNRACKFNFESEDYAHLPKEWLDLMRRLLEKDPKKRITATQALNHEFFANDNYFAEFNQKRNSCFIQTTKEEHDKKLSIQCQSPLMMTRNNARKNPGMLRDDSCLKFKMKENVMTGRTDQNGETIEEIDSPALKKKATKNGGESRFKKMANQ